MADARQYGRGSNAKLAGLPYDPKRCLDWRMGWLETRPECNAEVENIPSDWQRQTQAYRHAIEHPDQSQIIIKLELSGRQAQALMQLCNNISLADRRKLSSSDDEALQMHTALQVLQKSLSKAGC